MSTAGLLIATVLLGAPVPAVAPARGGEEAAVLAVVQRFFDAMAGKDLGAAREIMLLEATYFSVRHEGGDPALRGSTNGEFVESLEAVRETMVERIWDPTVLVHDRIAVVWAPYDFHRDGAFSHCGVDAFSLVKTEAGWKIAGAVYTVEKEGCRSSPLGPPS